MFKPAHELVLEAKKSVKEITPEDLGALLAGPNAYFTAS